MLLSRKVTIDLFRSVLEERFCLFNLALNGRATYVLVTLWLLPIVLRGQAMKPHDIDVSNKCSAIRFTNLGGEDPCNSNPKAPCRHLGWLRFYTGVNASWQKLSALPYADGSDTVFEGEPTPRVLGLENTLSISLASINNSPAHAQFRVELSPNLEFTDGSHSLTDTVTSPDGKIYKFRLISTASCPLPSQAQAKASSTATIHMRNGTDITGSTQTVVVGERIALKGQCPSPGLWSVPGDTVADYVVTRPPQTGTVKRNFDKTQPDIFFYWIEPGNSIHVMYSCADANVHLSAQVIFNVQGPNADIHVCPGEPDIHDEKGTLQFTSGKGRPSETLACMQKEPNFEPPSIPDLPGMTFFAHVSQPASAKGLFIWAQIISETVFLVSNTGRPCEPVAVGVGLDNDGHGNGVFPYKPSDLSRGDLFITADSPGISSLFLPAYRKRGVEYPPQDIYSREGINFTAQMYLLWKPTFPEAIYIPLGFVDWSFKGTAIKDSGVWQKEKHSQVRGTFKKEARYPEWQRITAPVSQRICY